MNHSKQEKKQALLTSTLAGGAFGLVIGIVFLLLEIVDHPPLVFLPALVLLTAGVSGLSGLLGAVLDDMLKRRGISNPALRSLVLFTLIALITFGSTILIISNLQLFEISPELTRFAMPAMFLGLVFGIIVTLINYRLETMEQKMRLLEVENRYLAELAHKDQLLDEAARNLAVAEERNSMARELHDTISQGIHGIVFSLRTLRRQMGKNSDAEEVIGHLEETTQATLQELRRLIMELTPSPLENNSLAEALRLHCDLFSRRQGIPVSCDIRYDGKLSPEQEVAVYRIVQEALANVQKHAKAGSVILSLGTQGDQTILRIQDNGQGFNPASTDKGNGLANMAARARQNNGTFSLQSRHGSGTSIEVLFDTSLY